MKVKIVILAMVLAVSILGCSPQPVSIENVYLHQSIEDGNTIEHTAVFPAEIKNIYLTVEVKNITPEDELKVIWTFLDAEDIIDEQFSVVEQPGSGYINFNIHIVEGFPSGNYRADVYLNGELEEELDFSVR